MDYNFDNQNLKNKSTFAPVHNDNLNIKEQSKTHDHDEQKEPLHTQEYRPAENQNEPDMFTDNPVYAPTTTPTAYTKLQFSNLIPRSFEDPEKGERSEDTSRVMLPPNEESVQDALLGVFFSSFNIIFGIGLLYYYYSSGNYSEARLTLAIIIVSSLIIKLCYIFNGNIRKVAIWKSSKLFLLMSLIPLLTPVSLALADLVYALRERQNRAYIRPWRSTKAVYLVESLFLALPLAVLQSIHLLEDVDSLPSLKGFLLVIGVAILILEMSFARIRYDSDLEPERFGSGVSKIVKGTIVFGNKGLWVITLVCLAVSVRYRSGQHTIVPALIALAGLTLVYEIPIILPTVKCCNRITVKLFGMFFFIPQFASLFVVVFWTNTDLNIYTTNVGISALGSYTLFESLALMGWLLDSCQDREMDILPIYPHFFGDLYGARKRPK